MRTKPSVVQEVVSHMRKAEKDDSVKAVVLKIYSPGGAVTASDILYKEIVEFKNRTESQVVVYRRASYPDDNLYNTATVQESGRGLQVINLGLPDSVPYLQAGFYYLWAPGIK